MTVSMIAVTPSNHSSLRTFLSPSIPLPPSILSVTATRGWLSSSTRAVPRILSSSTHTYISRTTPETRTESYTFCYYAEEGIKREVASSWSPFFLLLLSPFVSLPFSVTQRPLSPSSSNARLPLPFLFPETASAGTIARGRRGGRERERERGGGE